MVNYTPGPWVLQKREDEEEATLVKHEGETDDFLVCETNMNWRYAKRNAANARLIAAAPELLEAARLLADFAANAPTLDYNEDKVLSWISFVVHKANMAVAKAEGE